MTRLLVLVLAAMANAQPPQYADTIYARGTILTLNRDAGRAEAVAVKDGRIIAVGSDAEVRRAAGPNTVLVDLRGRTLLPGFYAAHDHFQATGAAALYYADLNSPPIGKIETIGGLIAALKEKARSIPAGAWIVGRGYDDTLIREKRHPTREDLDQVSKQQPVFITHISGHFGAANSRALAIAGVTRDTPQPQGGRIRKDVKTGEPNGVFEEKLTVVTRHIPPLSQEQRVAAIEWAGKHYTSRGVTTAVVAHGNAVSLRDFQLARRAGMLPLRIIAMSARESPDSLSSAESGGVLSGFGDDWIRQGAIKITADGSIQGYTGYLREPYSKPPEGNVGERGYPLRPRADLGRMVKQLHAGGYQVAIHGNGDAAIDDILFAFKEALNEHPNTDARHRIEHCQTVREDQLDEMKRLGITPSFFIGHVYYWGDRHRDIFLGPVRASRISPLASAVRRSIRFTLHDDTPVTPVNPLMLVWDAVNRLTRDGKVLGPEQRITVEQALRAVTIDAAWQNFEEATKGSVEPGKLADFVVLDQNPLTVAPATIRDIAISMTVVGGRTVYQRRSSLDYARQHAH